MKNLRHHSQCSLWALGNGLYLKGVTETSECGQNGSDCLDYSNRLTLWGFSILCVVLGWVLLLVISDSEIQMERLVLSMNPPATRDHSQQKTELCVSSSDRLWRGAGWRGRFSEGLLSARYKQVGKKGRVSTKHHSLQTDQITRQNLLKIAWYHPGYLRYKACLRMTALEIVVLSRVLLSFNSNSWDEEWKSFSNS